MGPKHQNRGNEEPANCEVFYFGRDLKKNYFDWLIETDQEGKAAKVKEEEGDFVGAINLYLRGNLPALAANVVLNYNVQFPQDLIEKIALALSQAQMWERAGEFYEEMDVVQRAIECYCKGSCELTGNAYGKALELAKKSLPNAVAQLEERWGDYLFSQRMTEHAVNHYIEAGKY